MRNFHVHPNVSTQYQPAVNLDRLWTLVSEQTRTKYAKDSKKAPVMSRLYVYNVNEQTTKERKSVNNLVLCFFHIKLFGLRHFQ